jgi:DNA-binding transcriptional regulator YiaG
MAKKVAEGMVSEPLCHLVIKAVRVDSPPCQNSPQSLAELLTKYRLKSNLNRETLAANLGVSLGTLKSWKRARTKPSRRFWQELRALVNPEVG